MSTNLSFTKRICIPKNENVTVKHLLPQGENTFHPEISKCSLPSMQISRSISKWSVKVHYLVRDYRVRKSDQKSHFFFHCNRSFLGRVVAKTMVNYSSTFWRNVSCKAISRSLIAGIGTSLGLWGLSDDSFESVFDKTVTRMEQAPVRSVDLGMMAPRMPIRIFQYNPNLQIAFDTRTRNPVYVLERLVVGSDEQNKKTKQKRPNFFTEEKLHKAFQSRNEHYTGTPYDRGHMAPAANHAHNDKAFKDTFTLTNISPQNSVLNRTLWAQLENWTRKVARYYKDKETFVLTGPLWLPARQVAPKEFQYNHTALGQPPQVVAVPTHFFKIVVVVSQNLQITACACFVMPNNEPTEKNSTPNLSKYLVCWSDLEAVTGLEFFPYLVKNDHWKAMSDDLTLREMQGEPLLLPGASPVVQKSMFGGKPQLQHLCAKNNCNLAQKQFQK